MFGSTEKYGPIYKRILKKFSDGTFTTGKDCSIPHYYIEGHISSVPVEKRSAGLCIELMGYGRCSLSDVPEKERTREFYLGAYSGCYLNSDSDSVLNYIKNNIKDFDRQFFRDLIVTNKYATYFEGNCFAIMPLEYIDEEMCSLAILHTTNWGAETWLKTVYSRKPEVLTSDIWKLAARLYARTNNIEEFLKMTPDEYKDEEYYFEMCNPDFNEGTPLDTSDSKKGIMDFIPKEIITIKFLVALLNLNIKNITRFNEAALETGLPIAGSNGKTILEKAWKFAVRNDGYLIRDIPLNEERIKFFLSLYDKDSSEYRWGFKDVYKRYMKEKTDPETLARTEQTTRGNNLMLATVILGSAMSGNPDAADEKLNLPMATLLPIKYNGTVPCTLCKEYDTEEYLALQYGKLGIKIVEEYDNLFYRVILPEGWQIDNNGYWNIVTDKNGNVVIEYFYDSKFYDRDAYVKKITVPDDQPGEDQAKEMKP